MWDRIVTKEATDFIKRHTEGADDETFPHIGKMRGIMNKNKKQTKHVNSIEETISNFVDALKENVDYKSVVIMAINWSNYTDVKQANLAIHFVGEGFASMFIMLMDFLSMQYQKGELK